MLNKYRVSMSVALAAVLLTVLCSTAFACSVPVFRYALERWWPDLHTSVIFHDAPLEGEHLEALELLEASTEAEGQITNMRVVKLDMNEEENLVIMKRVLGEDQEVTYPWFAVISPGGDNRGKPIVQGELSTALAKSVIDSPVRRDLARRILQGESAIWILLESGRKEEDDAAEAVMKEAIEFIHENLELPMIAPQDLGVMSNQEATPLKLEFTIKRLSRDNKEESFLIDSLMKSESDLYEYDEPMAFPVFGRGRALYALVGKGINRENIIDACAFMAGACSCEVKELNPGTDLLMATDWDSLLGGYLLVDEALPPLAGFSSFASMAPMHHAEMPENPDEMVKEIAELVAEAGVVDTADTDADSEPEAGGNSILRNYTFVIFLIGVAVIATVSALMKRRA